MFILAFFIGIYASLIFAFGITGLLTKELITIVTVLWALLLLTYERGVLFAIFTWLTEKRFNKVSFRKNKLIFLLLSLIVLQAGLNLIGALAPELAFDALWYHLTLPKLYLVNHSIFHIPGGLLYYSDMPKAGEMLYVGALAFGNEITAKMLHFCFGLLTGAALFMIARKFFSPLISLLAVVIFYSNILVAWESTTAYIDLIRTFFEIMALWSFVNWLQTKKEKWIIITACMVGFAISTKLLAISSAFLFAVLIALNAINKQLPRRLLFYFLIVFLIPLPWFLFSYIHTGNPIYPLFSPIFSGINEKVFSFLLLSPLHFLSTIWTNFTRANDPISPLYLIGLPLLMMLYPRMSKIIKQIFIFTILGTLVWYVTSQVEGTRILMPYLPAFSLLLAWLIDYTHKNKTAFRLTIGLVLLVSMTTIAYRGLATIKYIPVVFGQETKQEFLINHLSFSFGDFYDTDNYFAKTIKQEDVVLLYGFHNLYYVNFPFIDSSWVSKGDRFSYVAVQNSALPKRFKDWQLVYKNDKTLVQLYKPPKGVCQKICVY